MPHDSSQLWRRDKPTVAHGPWFQQQDKPFWELQETWQPEPRFDTAKRLLAHTNPFHHADRYTITPPPHAVKPASDPHKYIPDHRASHMGMEHANRLPLFKVPRNVKRAGAYTMKVGEDNPFRPKSPSHGVDKQLFELPEYPSQGRRFTDVLRHFSAGFRPEDEPSKPKPQDVFEEAPLYSSFTKDNVFPKLDDSQSALDLSRSKSRSRRSKSAEPIAEGTEGMESSIGSMPSQAMGSNASRGSGGGGGTRQSFELSSSGALPPAGGYTEKYLRAPSAELLSSGGAQSTSLSSTAGVRAGAFQMMLSR